ncbi:MAG: DUF4845 domain-containing protein [Betaproteobacteria bacterium]
MSFCVGDEPVPAGNRQGQRGFSLLGLVSTLLVLALAGVLLVRAGPGVLEYWAIKKAVAAAAAVSDTPAELRERFDKMASVGFSDTLQGKDLEISGRGDSMRVRFKYDKRIVLFGPFSLLIAYRGSNPDDGQDVAAN